MLKIRLTSRGWGRATGLSRRLFEEFVYGDLRVAFDDQSLLLGSGFTLSALWFWLLGHPVLLSHPFLSGDKVVPQPGIGPGRHEWARGCKPRLSANSSTGAHNKALNVGAVTPAKTSPAPALFGPVSAALNISPHGAPPLRVKTNQATVAINSFAMARAFAPPVFVKPVFLSPPLPEGHYVTVFGQLSRMRSNRGDAVIRQ